MVQVDEILPHGKNKEMFILESQYYCCWCPGDIRSQHISSHSDDPSSPRIFCPPAPEGLILHSWLQCDVKGIVSPENWWLIHNPKASMSGRLEVSIQNLLTPWIMIKMDRWIWWPLGKIAAVLQTEFSNLFSWIKIFVLLFKRLVSGG